VDYNVVDILFVFEMVSYNVAYFFIYCLKGNNTMDTKIALIGIIVESAEAATPLNHLLHEYGPYIVGRMGIPYSKKRACPKAHPQST
jgi:hypothetical protein